MTTTKTQWIEIKSIWTACPGQHSFNVKSIHNFSRIARFLLCAEKMGPWNDLFPYLAFRSPLICICTEMLRLKLSSCPCPPLSMGCAWWVWIPGRGSNHPCGTLWPRHRGIDCTLIWKRWGHGGGHAELGATGILKAPTCREWRNITPSQIYGHSEEGRAQPVQRSSFSITLSLIVVPLSELV